MAYARGAQNNPIETGDTSGISETSHTATAVSTEESAGTGNNQAETASSPDLQEISLGPE